MKNRHNGLVGLLLFGMLTNPIQKIYPEMREIYVNENNQIIKIVGNSLDIPYNWINVFRYAERITMNPRIDYQYSLLLPQLDFSKNKIQEIAPINVPNPMPKNEKGEIYSNLEMNMIFLMNNTGIHYPNKQIVEALKKSDITSVEKEGKIQLTIYPDEAKGLGYEKIELSLLGEGKGVTPRL